MTAEPKRVRVVHYINQFFAGIGAEEAAGHGVEVRTGPVGPGLALQRALGDRGQVVSTVVCGDNFFAEQQAVALEAVLAAIAEARPDLVICGPAFNAGRYGLACGAIGRAVSECFQVPVVSGMYPENPAVEEFRRFLYIVPTGASVAGMGQAVARMAALALKLAGDEPLESADQEGYLARGFRRNALAPETGARRAVRMLLDKVRGQPFSTEMPLPSFDRVEPAEPLLDLSTATIALVTEGGVVPRGNPDNIEAHSATRWARYRIDGLSALSAEAYDCVHGGFDPSNVRDDPHRLVPLDVLRDFETQGVIGKLHEYLYVTVGNGTAISNARQFAREIAEELKAADVQGVVLPAT
jgi:glycine reductase complex component B subunit gamma